MPIPDHTQQRRAAAQPFRPGSTRHQRLQLGGKGLDHYLKFGAHGDVRWRHVDRFGTRRSRLLGRLPTTPGSVCRAVTAADMAASPCLVPLTPSSRRDERGSKRLAGGREGSLQIVHNHEVVRRPQPREADLARWKQISAALRIAAREPGELADLPLFSHIDVKADRAAREAELRRRVSELFSRLREELLVDAPFAPTDYPRQAIACWCVYVCNGTSQKGAGRHVGAPSNGWLREGWRDGGTTGPERMWVSLSLADRDITKAAWPGIARILREMSTEFSLRATLGGGAVAVDASGGDTAAQPLALPGTLEGLSATRSGEERPVMGDLAILDWEQRLFTDDRADTTFDIDVSVKNISDSLQPYIALPVYGEDPRPPVAAVRCKGATFKVQADPWDPVIGGYFRIPFPDPLVPGDDIHFSYRYALGEPQSMTTGWYEWHLAVLQHRFRLAWRFADSWAISNLHKTRIDKGDYFIPEPILDGQTIYWELTDALPSKRYRLDWDLRYGAHA